MSDEFGFYRSICHIFCGEESGNGYLVAPDLVLTADHVLPLQLKIGKYLVMKKAGHEMGTMLQFPHE